MIGRANQGKAPGTVGPTMLRRTDPRVGSGPSGIGAYVRNDAHREK